MLVGVETKLIDNTSGPIGGSSSFVPTFITFADKGPVNNPTLVQGPTELLNIFGEADLSKKQYGLFAAFEFMKQGSIAWIVRAGADTPGFAEAGIKARDGKPLMTIRSKNSGEVYNNFRVVVQDINPINFDGVVTMQAVIEMINPLSPAEWAEGSGLPIEDYPAYIMPDPSFRYNIDFATQRVYNAINDEDQVNHFGEYIYNAEDDTCYKQQSELIKGNETEDFMFIFEREPFTSTIMIEKMKATINFAGGSNAIETSWAPIFNLGGYKKYDAARTEFKAESDLYTMAKNEYVQLPVGVQQYVKDNAILSNPLNLNNLKADYVYPNKIKDYGTYNNIDTAVGTVAYAIIAEEVCNLAVGDDVEVTVTDVDGNDVAITVGAVRSFVMPTGGDVFAHNYPLTAEEDNFLLRELFKKDCPQEGNGPATLAPIEGTDTYYNVSVQFANAIEKLATIIEKMNNIKKDPSNQAYRVDAISPGEWGNMFQAMVKYNFSLDETTISIFKEVGADLVEVESNTTLSHNADSMVFANVKIQMVTPVDTTNSNTIPVNDVDQETGADIPMPLMGGADMFTDADYLNDMKLAPYIAGSVAHQTGVWAMQNYEEYEFSALACPYFSQFGMVSGEMVSLAESRRDFHAIVDTPNVLPQGAYNWKTSGNHNSKFESIYYPWVMKLDSKTKKVVPVPPSGSALQSMALSRRNAKLCDAPAGINRGVIYDAVAIVNNIKLSQAMRDRLYAIGVNPIIKGLTEGIHIMGQRTTLAKTSPMQKVGTMLMIEKIVRDLSMSGKGYLMDLSLPSLWNTIQNNFQSYLNGYTANGCLALGTAEVSATYNPPAVLAQSKLNVVVKIQPSPYVEHIIIPITVES